MSPGSYARVMALTPPTSLRYGRLVAGVKGVVELAGIEPATSALQRRRSPS